MSSPNLPETSNESAAAHDSVALICSPKFARLAVSDVRDIGRSGALSAEGESRLLAIAIATYRHLGDAAVRALAGAEWDNWPDGMSAPLIEEVMRIRYQHDGDG
jgi:hypothetical protein